ncbi:MAG: hypothetical protein WKG32_23210 [Gemmatimonadaceae bacterium]
MDVAEELGIVAFGTGTIEFFKDVDKRRAGQPVPVLFYATHVPGGARHQHVATWFGWYVGHLTSRSGGHRSGSHFVRRPPAAMGGGGVSTT